MKKILFFIPTLTGGGAEKVLVNLVNNMDSKKFDITVMTLFNVGVNIKSLNKDIKYKYIFKKIFRGNIHILKIFSPEFLFKKFVKDEYDYIVSYLQGPTTRIVGGCTKKKTKIINYIHCEIKSIEMLKKSYRNRKELEAIYRRYDSTVFVADSVRCSFEKKFPYINKNLKILYNTVEDKEIEDKAQKQITDINFSNKKINIISIGRFTKEKGFERLIRCVGKLINIDKRELNLYLLGEGKLREEYEKIIKDENIQDYVHFLGYKANPYKYLKNSDLFVCSSYYEGFSTAVTESIIVGTPVITTECSGMREMLGSSGEYGIIVQNDQEALYRKLQEVLSDRQNIESLRKKVLARRDFFKKEISVENFEEFVLNL